MSFMELSSWLFERLHAPSVHTSLLLPLLKGNTCWKHLSSYINIYIVFLFLFPFFFLFKATPTAHGGSQARGQTRLLLLAYPTLLFLCYLPSCSITSDWIEFPVLYSRTSLLIHPQGNSLHLLTPDSEYILLPPLCLATTSLFSLSICSFLFCIASFVAYIRFHICDNYLTHTICPSLSDLFHLVWESLGPSMLLQIVLFCFFFMAE